jgi:predicted ABC-type ATPase
MSDEDLQKQAFSWIKSREGKEKLIESFASPSFYFPEPRPITLFMAGSPGAGKTEVSKGFIKRFTQKPVRIDADEIRSLCPGYNGSNSSLFQKCADKGINILYDFCLEKNYSIILDGTFAYCDAIHNIERSLKRKRTVEVWFIYQDPIQAWKITKAREVIEGRNVPLDVFVSSYFKSQKNVNEAKEKFGDKISLNFILKNFEGGFEKLKVNIDKIDSYIPKSYTEETLRSALLELTQTNNVQQNS